MKFRKVSFIVCAAAISLFIACNSSDEATTTTEKKAQNITEDQVGYSDGSVSMTGLLVYDANVEGKRPAVIVVPEWWGLNDYPKMRARQLAALGYVAFAIDVYGNNKVTDIPDSAAVWSSPYYQDPQMAYNRINTALTKLKTYSQVDTNKVAAIGYCFGGGLLLNTARMGMDLNGVASFHGGLISGVPARKDLLTAKILVLNGEADQMVLPTEVDQFKKQMDSIGADYTFKNYAGAEHAFSNPAAAEFRKKYPNLPIQYNAAADSASWTELRVFLEKIFK